MTESGATTRNAHFSGRRTAMVLGNTSQPKRISASKPASVQTSGQCPTSAIHIARASITALASVLPSASIVTRFCGSASNRATSPPRAGRRSANCRTCHLVSENSDVSASEKKKLTAAKHRTTAIGNKGAAICSQDGGKAESLKPKFGYAGAETD